MFWRELLLKDEIKLYAGDLSKVAKEKGFIGTSLNNSDQHHIQHDIRKPMDLPNDTVDIYQSEDVFEHVQFGDLFCVINEIYRVLKPSGFFRLSVPDYRCDVLYDRSEKNDSGEIVFDPLGGGNKLNPGHVWFPKIESIRMLIGGSMFGRTSDVKYMHYFDEQGIPVVNNIDYSDCFVTRTPDNDKRVENPRRPMSIVVDMIKNG